MRSDMLAVPNDDSEVTDVANDRSVFIFGMKLLLANFMTEDEDALYMHPLLYPPDKYLTFLMTVYFSFHSYSYSSCGEDLHVEFVWLVLLKGKVGHLQNGGMMTH
jgi:hypothetical protein